MIAEKGIPVRASEAYFGKKFTKDEAKHTYGYDTRVYEYVLVEKPVAEYKDKLGNEPL